MIVATATEIVREDIIKLLGLREPKVILTSFDRSNLEFIVRRKTTIEKDLVPTIETKNGTTIVYVLTKKKAEEVARELRSFGINCQHYHAKIGDHERLDVLEKFRNDKIKVVVATIAFGMGIDKKDVRCVIHYGASKNLETYELLCTFHLLFIHSNCCYNLFIAFLSLTVITKK